MPASTCCVDQSRGHFVHVPSRRCGGGPSFVHADGHSMGTDAYLPIRHFRRPAHNCGRSAFSHMVSSPVGVSPSNSTGRRVVTGGNGGASPWLRERRGSDGCPKGRAPTHDECPEARPIRTPTLCENDLVGWLKRFAVLFTCASGKSLSLTECTGDEISEKTEKHELVDGDYQLVSPSITSVMLPMSFCSLVVGDLPRLAPDGASGKDQTVKNGAVWTLTIPTRPMSVDPASKTIPSLSSREEARLSAFYVPRTGSRRTQGPHG